jgi:hypothetical protein
MTMNRKMKCAGALWGLALCLGGCESRVERATEDLKEAERDSPKVAAELEHKLAKAKAEVARLEEKLALARQGITDDVREERKDLEQALKRQGQHVQEEIGEAQRAAQQHRADSNAAEQQLERTKPTEQVKASVHTEVERTPVRGEMEVEQKETTITVPNTQVKEVPSTQGKDTPSTQVQKRSERTGPEMDQPRGPSPSQP